MNKRLHKVSRGKMIDGVCAGFAEYLNLDPTIVRLIWVLLSMCYGGGVLLYIIAMIIMPREDYLP